MLSKVEDPLRWDALTIGTRYTAVAGRVIVHLMPVAPTNTHP